MTVGVAAPTAAGLLLMGVVAAGGPPPVAQRAARADAAAPTRYRYEVVRTYPHDPAAFTQGLVYSDGDLFESTGLRGASTLRQVRLETGEVVRRHVLSTQYFGEGLALWG